MHVCVGQRVTCRGRDRPRRAAHVTCQGQSTGHRGWELGQDPARSAVVVGKWGVVRKLGQLKQKLKYELKVDEMDEINDTGELESVRQDILLWHH